MRTCLFSTHTHAHTHTKSNEKVGNRAFEFLYTKCCNVEWWSQYTVKRNNKTETVCFLSPGITLNKSGWGNCYQVQKIRSFQILTSTHGLY